MGSTLVQYIVVRGDLGTKLGWPTGALITQACHACSAALHLYGQDPNTISYLKNLDSMHKVVLKAENEDSLLQLADQLKSNSIDHKIWIEQPENFPTCLATRPYNKSDIQQYFKKLKLFK